MRLCSQYIQEFELSKILSKDSKKQRVNQECKNDYEKLWDFWFNKIWHTTSTLNTKLKITATKRFSRLSLLLEQPICLKLSKCMINLFSLMRQIILILCFYSFVNINKNNYFSLFYEREKKLNKFNIK